MSAGGFVRGIAMAAFAVLCAHAQPTSAPPNGGRDPLMTLMLSQPRLDIETPVHVDAAFDPPEARPGQAVVYRITLNALKDAISWSGHPPEVRGLPFRTGASGEIMQVIGTNMQPRSAFNFHTWPERAGLYVVPEFVLRVYGVDVRVPAAMLHVSPSVPPASAQKLLLEVTPARPFVGEAARVRILSPAPSGMVQALAQVQLTGQGFMQEVTANRQAIETGMLNGHPVPHYVYETVLTPIMPGPTEVCAQAFAVGNRFPGSVVITGPAAITGSAALYMLVDSDPLRLDFRPLPATGRLPGFAGAVGDYIVDGPQLSTNVVRAGDPLTLVVSIRGRGNPGRLSMPSPPRYADWQVSEPRPEQLPPQVLQSKGSISFTYTLIPLHDGVRSTPELPFSFFHPGREEYVSQNIPPVPVKVLPAAGQRPADLARLLRERARDAGAGKEPSLGPVATLPGASAATLTPVQLRPWFPLVQAAPALIFGGLLMWDRRRRYLEAHPVIVLRKRALRALRRHRSRMRKQGLWGNEPGFVESAVAALRVISAPHYPAAPDAVTCDQVLRLLGNDAPENARAVVTRLFDFSNARRFSNIEPKPQPESLPLIREVEPVLDYLKERCSILSPPHVWSRPKAKTAPLNAMLVLSLVCLSATAAEDKSRECFDGGMTAYRAGEYGFAAELFGDAARLRPSAGALRNLGNAEWQRGKTGRAILAWEQAVWVDPFDRVAKGNLEFARKTAQVEAPSLAWHEAASAYLPSAWWAWLAGVSLWLAVGAVVLPGVLRVRKAAWHQTVAAIGLAAFLLSLPAYAGVVSRSKLGFILERDTPLRLTPTAEAQSITSLAAGDPVRVQGRKGAFLLVSTSRARGWVEASAFGPVCPASVSHR